MYFCFSHSRVNEPCFSTTRDLADIHHRGYLNASTFVVAMYLIQATMSGKLKAIPPTLPPSLYFDTSSSPNGSNNSFSLTSPLSPTSSSFLHQQPSTSEAGKARAWDITGEEKATADEFFNFLDEQQQGYLEGKVARAHFLQSGLPEPDVKQIWYDS